MPPSELELELIARLQITQYMLANALTMIYELKGISASDVQKFHAELQAQMARETFPLFGPAMSDHFSALLNEELNKLVLAIETLGGDVP
jgi:hypothetical protein